MRKLLLPVAAAVALTSIVPFANAAPVGPAAPAIGATAAQSDIVTVAKKKKHHMKKSHSNMGMDSRQNMPSGTGSSSGANMPAGGAPGGPSTAPGAGTK